MLSLNEEVQALPKVGVEEQHEENVRMQKMWEENKIVDKLKKNNTSKRLCMFSKKLRTLSRESSIRKGDCI